MALRTRPSTPTSPTSWRREGRCFTCRDPWASPTSCSSPPSAWSIEDGRTEGPFHSSRPVAVEIDVDVARENAAYQVGFDLLSGDGLVLRSWHTDGPPDDWPPIGTGRSTLRCVLPAGLLNEGRYAIAPRADVYKSYWIVNGDEAVWFDVVKDHLESPFSWVKNPGPLAPLLEWTAAGNVASDAASRRVD